MSSFWAAYMGHGLVLDSQEFEAFLEAYVAAVPDDDPALKTLDAYMEWNYGIDEVKFAKPGTDDRFSLFCVDDGCCDGFRLWNYRVDGKKNKDYEMADIPMQNVYVLNAEHALDGVDCFDGPAYPSYEAFVQEFKDKMAAYLPDDFDWDSHIGSYSYACYA